MNQRYTIPPMSSPPAPTLSTPTSTPRRRWSLTRWVFILVLLNLSWRTVRYLLVFPMWGDEAFVAVNFFDHSFADMFRPLDHNQIVPVGFMCINLAISKLLGQSELALRLFPFLTGIGAILLFVPLCRRLLDRRSAMLAIAVFAASYYSVRHASEVKSYSFDLLIALLLLIQTIRVHDYPRSSGRWLILGILCALAIWCSYPAVFIAGGSLMFLAGAAWRERTPWAVGLWLGSGVLLCVSFLSMYAIISTGQAELSDSLASSDYWLRSFPPLSEPWKLPFWFIEIHTGNMLAYPIGGKRGGSTATFIMVLFGCVYPWKNNRTVFWLLLAPLPLMLIAAALQKYPYGSSARVAQHIAPAICMLAGTGLLAIFKAVLSNRATVNAYRFVPMVMSVIILGGIIVAIIKPHKDISDKACREMVRWLADQTQPDERWIVFGDFAESPHTQNMIDYGGTAARMRYQILLLAPVEVLWAPLPGDIDPEPSLHIWLLVYHDDLREFPTHRLEAYLAGIVSTFGEYTTHHFDLHEADESIDLLHFSGQDSKPPTP